MLIDIPTEQTSAATDFLLFLVAAGIAIKLIQYRSVQSLRASLWIGIATLFGLGALIGTIAHGLLLPETIKAICFSSIYLCLGLSIAGFVVAATLDLKSPSTAMKLLPYAAAVAIAFYMLTVLLKTSFIFLIAYETAAMFFALYAYTKLWLRGFSGAGYIICSILLAITAAAIQATAALSFTLIWPFDHNSVFHLIQTVSIVMLYSGLKRSFGQKR